MQALPPDPPPASGKSIFGDTIAEMTCPEVEAAIARGAVGLWAIGVIEQHGPHLPTGTDVYIPGARLRAVKARLADAGIASLILPPFYWGVNAVSASFPASIKVRAEVMVELLVDVMKSLAGDGMKQLFLVSGHNDRAHNEAIVAAVRKGARESGLAPCFVCDAAIAERLGLGADDAEVLRFASPPDVPFGAGLDIHAGGWETSVMLGCNPELVRRDALAGLAPTDLGGDALAAWRQGGQVARRITPLGYFGAPATASAARGLGIIDGEARAIARSLARRLGRDHGAKP